MPTLPCQVRALKPVLTTFHNWTFLPTSLALYLLYLGWEHVYSGEYTTYKTVDGQHSWVRYYLLEKAGEINYHGYQSHDGDLIGTFQYTWNEYVKKEGGFLISTSPGKLHRSLLLSLQEVCNNLQALASSHICHRLF